MPNYIWISDNELFLVKVCSKLIQMVYLLFIWNSDIIGHPVFLCAKSGNPICKILLYYLNISYTISDEFKIIAVIKKKLYSTSL